jgi:hypothetical protein
MRSVRRGAPRGTSSPVTVARPGADLDLDLDSDGVPVRDARMRRPAQPAHRCPRG